MANGHILVLNVWMQTLKYRLLDWSTCLVANIKLFTINIGIASLLSLKIFHRDKKNYIIGKIFNFSLLFLVFPFVFIMKFKEGSRD